MQYPRIFITISLLFSFVIFFSRCFNNNTIAGTDPRGKQFAGSQACVNCHKNISESYAHNNHYKTSSPVDYQNLKKMISVADNSFSFADTSHIIIEEKEKVLFQSWFVNNLKSASAKFDVAFGSAEKAQTYGYWKDENLFQLPLTFYTKMNTWANSPGFPMRYANFGRIIKSRCFECHSSFINKEFVQSGSLSVSEKLDKNSILYGIDCERCHGPAADHVKFQQENPSIKTTGHIASIKNLSRQQKLDVCAVCHSGNDQETQRSLFAFIPGDTLANFYFPDFGAENNEPDVHGKQVQMLQMSKCFRMTDMTCNSCHNSHESAEKDNNDVFISKCMDCHQHSLHAQNKLNDSKSSPESKNLLAMNCIDCHMPLEASKSIYFNGPETKKIPYFIRTHKIAIYQKID